MYLEVTYATTEMVHVRIDKRIKARGGQGAGQHGAIGFRCRSRTADACCAEKALPFDVKVPNAANAAAMREARNGRLSSFRNVSDLMADLNAED